MTGEEHPLYLECEECGNEQPDMGRNVACEECGARMPEAERHAGADDEELVGKKMAGETHHRLIPHNYPHNYPLTKCGLWIQGSAGDVTLTRASAEGMMGLRPCRRCWR